LPKCRLVLQESDCGPSEIRRSRGACEWERTSEVSRSRWQSEASPLHGWWNNLDYQKGLARGPVGISRRHSLAIVNRGGASAAHIIALKNEVQAGVREKFGIELTPEPVFVGFE